jgi:carbamoyl-phosphate synthase large subunit
MREQTVAMALELGVVGLMNVQFAVQGRRDLRARGEPARLAHRALRLQVHRRVAGQGRRPLHGRQTLAQQGSTEIIPPYYSVKEAVFPFAKFPGVDPILGRK